MTTMIDTAQRTAPVQASTTPGRVTLARVAAAEWIKFRTVRSTVYALVATVALMVGISVLAAWGSTQMEDLNAGPGGLSARARLAVAPFLPTALALQSFDWIYGYDARTA